MTFVRLAGLLAAYRLAIFLYNISPFHPLHKFPGPRFASMTYAYEAYYDLWLDGKYTRRIKTMHGEYGRFPTEYKNNSTDETDKGYQARS